MFPFLEASSWNCGSSRQAYSLVILQFASPPGGSFRIYKAVRRTRLRVLYIALEKELAALTMLNDCAVFIWPPLTVSLCLCVFLTLLIKPILWLQISMDQRQAEYMAGARCVCRGEGLFSSVQFSSVAQLCPTLCKPMNHSTAGLSVHHQLPEFTQTNVHSVSDAMQPSHPLLSPSPSAPNPSQHQSFFQ